MKTLLQVINAVAVNMRRGPYTTITDDTDAEFIHSMVNVAKDMVEGEAQWNVLQDVVEFSSVAGTQTYDLNDGGVVTAGTAATERSQLTTAPDGAANFWDITNNGEVTLRRRTRDWITRQQARFPGLTESQAINFAIYPFADGLTVSFPFDPSGARNYRVMLYTPQTELTVASTALTAPWRPVVLATTALVAEERGEELGLNAATWWERYNSALSQALIVDMFQAADATLVAD